MASGNSGQGTNTRVAGHVPVTEQASEEEIDFIVESSAPGRAVESGEEKKRFVASLCQKFAIEICKKTSSAIDPDP